MTYGVVPEGFVRKPLEQILAEVQASLITEFGPDVIQTPQSPLGQLNGLFANLTAQLWEVAQDVYQSYDPDQAEGTRLDVLAKMRLLARAAGESDEEFRRAITNAGRARNDIQDLARAIVAVPGVTYVRVYLNESNEIDENGLPPGSVAVSVLGGDDEAIATEMRRYIVPGITTVGNVYVSTEIDGFCRSFALLRPILIPVSIDVTVRMRKDALGCPPPSTTAIRDGLVLELTSGIRRLLNGDDVDTYRVRSIIESAYPNVEVVSVIAQRIEDLDTAQQQVTDQERAVIAFIEMATVSIDDVTVTQVP